MAIVAKFQKASKKKAKLRLAFIGASGSGKTYSALAVASGLGGRIAVIDTEAGSSEKYAHKFDFDVLRLDSFHPRNYVDAINAAQTADYTTIIIDSLSHEWNGKGGALELVDSAAASSGGNSYAGWRDVTPLHNELINAILRSSCHVIATMRAKMQYELEKNEKGKVAPKKVGLGPVQRDGVEYEFDIVGFLDNGKLRIDKTRMDELSREGTIPFPGKEFGERLISWLEEGDDEPANPADLPEKTQQRIRNVFKAAEATLGVTGKPNLEAWVKSVLGKAKPSPEWTAEDFAALEANLLAKRAANDAA